MKNMITSDLHINTNYGDPSDALLVTCLCARTLLDPLEFTRLVTNCCWLAAHFTCLRGVTLNLSELHRRRLDCRVSLGFGFVWNAILSISPSSFNLSNFSFSWWSCFKTSWKSTEPEGRDWFFEREGHEMVDRKESKLLCLIICSLKDDCPCTLEHP